jgi:hypothetical protein
VPWLLLGGGGLLAYFLLKPATATGATPPPSAVALAKNAIAPQGTLGAPAIKGPAPVDASAQSFVNDPTDLENSPNP